MTPGLEKLLRIASEPRLPRCDERLHALPSGVDKSLVAELTRVLGHKNGFFAFESALHVFHHGSGSGTNLVDWNATDGWRRFYTKLPEALLFFAQDVLCCQFAIGESGVWRLEPESGSLEQHADTLEQWAERVLADYPVEVAWTLAHEWQASHGPLVEGMRLVPRRPFLLGGDFDVQNLIPMEAAAAMENLGRLYAQVAAIPDGENVTVRGWLTGDVSQYDPNSSRPRGGPS